MTGPSWLAPVPPSTAIEIASHRVTVAGISRLGTKPTVSAYASEPLSAEAVAPAPAGANIPEPAVVVDALKRALDRTGLRSVGRVALVVPDSIARVSLLTFEKLPPKASDIDQLIRWQLKKATPYPIEEAAISSVVANVTDQGTTIAAVVARRDVIAQYEGVVSALGIHAGIVDLSSFNVMNTIIAGGAAKDGDSLVVTLAADATSLAILRGEELMFYRHRAAVEEEPLSALVHQTAMYHEDRLGGTRFARVWLSGSAFVGGAEQARRGIAAHLGAPAEIVDVTSLVQFRDPAGTPADVLDALAAPIGLLLRERKAA
jgi:type IV pilus assembly protein PilM